MKMFIALVLSSTILTCSALHDLRSIDEDNTNEESYHSEYIDQPESFDQSESFDQPESLDQSEFGVFNNPEHDESEIVAIRVHVKYQDAARAALLQLAADRRKKEEGITNSFLKVIDEYEKEIAEFQAGFGRRRVVHDQINRTEQFIREAVKNRRFNAEVLRALTALGIFFSEKIEVKRGLRKRSADNLARGARAFLGQIKDNIGDDAFNKYMGINGLITLMFVMDTTGSMSGDIEAAIVISAQIVNQTKENNVDYILSPFNDPSTGPITVKNAGEGKDFIKALEALRTIGGHDCPELSFKGMINALESGPQIGSPMYVFTDASPKDASIENKDIILDLAHNLDVKINFLTRRDTHCSAETGAFQPYEDLASETGGLVYPLHNSNELIRLSTLVSDFLKGSAYIGSGELKSAVSGRRRRKTEEQYSIPVDDSMEHLFITVVTQNSAAGIRLVDPAGNISTNSRELLKKGVIYNIDKPIVGVFRLIVPAEAGEHKYRVNSVGAVNIDFGHYYVFVASRGSRIPVPLKYPLQGFPTKAFVTIAGSEYVTPNSLRIKVVDERGAVHADHPLIPVGVSGVRYFVRFSPPSAPFRLQLHGQTVKGNKFVRVSSSEFQTKSVLMKLGYMDEPNILRRGQRVRITIVIRRGNAGAKSEIYSLNLKDERGYGKLLRQSRAVRRGRQGFARIEFLVPVLAPVGKAEKVEFSLSRKGEKTPVASLNVSFLIV